MAHFVTFIANFVFSWTLTLFRAFHKVLALSYEAIAIGCFLFVKAYCMNVFLLMFILTCMLLKWHFCELDVVPGSTYLFSFLWLPFNFLKTFLWVFHPIQLGSECLWCGSTFLPPCTAGIPCMFSHIPSSSHLKRSYKEHTSWCRSEKSQGLCLIMKNCFLYSIWLLAGYYFCSDLSNIVSILSL